jgi:hypothetical protein
LVITSRASEITGHGAAAAIAAVHDRGIQLVPAVGIEHRAAAGVKMRIVLQNANHPFHDIKACPAFLE